ncbi:MAG: hypothetical protein QOH99_928, partial [Frankiaceae bacterium]|nr:hypothetical protein [Frankiaceae bacterium]
ESGRLGVGRLARLSVGGGYAQAGGVPVVGVNTMTFGAMTTAGGLTTRASCPRGFTP